MYKELEHVKMAKRVAKENAATGETEYKWSRKTPSAAVGSQRYMLGRVENENENAFNLIIVENAETGQLTVLHRSDGKVVKLNKPSDFQTFLDAMLSR